VTAAEILGIGRTAAYELIRTGTWPTPILRLGKLIQIPTSALLFRSDCDGPVRSRTRSAPSP
jgi:hypothetical protein